MAKSSIVQGKIKQTKQYKAVLTTPITLRGNWVKHKLDQDTICLGLLLEPGIFLVKTSNGYYIDRTFELEPVSPDIVKQYNLEDHFKFE